MNLYTLVGNDDRPGVEARAFRRIVNQSEKQSENVSLDCKSSEAQCEKRSEAELQLYEASSYDLVIDSRQDVESCWKG